MKTATPTYQGSLSLAAYRFLHCALLIVCLLPAMLAWPQAPSTSADVATQATLEDLKNALAADSTIAEENRSKLSGQLDTAAVQLNTEASYREKSAALQGLIDSAPQQVARFEKLLLEAQATEADSGLRIAENATLSEIESQISLLSTERKTLSERRSELLQQVDSLAERTAKTRDRLVELQGQIDGVRGALELPANTFEQRVNRQANLARTQAWEAEKNSLELEIISEPARDKISTAERTWINRALADVDLKLEALIAAARDARAAATEQKLKTTAALAEKLESDDPALQDFAATNRTLAERLQKTAAQMETARDDSTDLQAELDYTEQDSHLMRRRLEVAGRKEILGRVMITRLDSLPDVDAIRDGIKNRNALIATTSLAHIDADEEFRTLAERQQYIEQLLPTTAIKDENEEQLLGKLVDDRQQLLENNLQTLGSLLRQLVDNNVTANQLIDTTEEYHKFLLGNLLWVRNFSFISLQTLSKQIEVLLNPQDWSRLPVDIIRGILQASWSTPLLILMIVVIVASRQLRKPFEELVLRPTPLSAASIWHIVLGLAMSLVLVLPWPMLLYLLGLFLNTVEPRSRFLQALAPALILAARTLYVLLFTRLLIRRLGVGRRLLKWDARMLEAIRLELHWAGPLIIVAGMLDIFALRLDVVASGGPLGAIATSIIAATIIAVCVRLLRREVFSSSGPLKASLRLAAALGLVVIIMQLLGLLFAADIYLTALVVTILWMSAVKIFADILERWLLIQRAKIERQARREKRASTDEDAEETEEVDDRVDVLSLSEAHAKLLSLVRLVAMGVVLWVIWSPSLPALNLLDTIALWNVADPTNLDTGFRSVSLFDLMLGVLVLVFTGLVAKHLPSLLQVFMVEWIKISAGARYASGILIQYVVIAVGGSIFLSIIGWDWSRVQWLVAALGVGIGFGLQEIVANFISGLIILFERPIRVGDIISAGGAEGMVKEIKPRATVIQTFEGKEHLIPNKELITGQVINWSLTENAVRVVIPVGIAYGSNVRQAMGLLVDSAREVDLVLDHPEPFATFEDFGDNALLLWLRCYVAEDRPTAWTELRMRINEKFEQAGIAISFPQRDVHLDVARPLRIQIDNGS